MAEKSKAKLSRFLIVNSIEELIVEHTGRRLRWP